MPVVIGWNPFFCWVVGVPSGLGLILRNDRNDRQTDNSQSVSQSPDGLLVGESMGADDGQKRIGATV